MSETKNIKAGDAQNTAYIRQVYCDQSVSVNKWLQRNYNKIHIKSIIPTACDTKEFGFFELIMVDYVALVPLEEIK